MKKRFSRVLEERGRPLADSAARQWDASIPGILRREIALVVDQINRLKEVREEQLGRLLRVECYVDTDLMQLQQRIPTYAPYQFPEKDKLKKRLFEIEKQRRDVRIHHEDRARTLEGRLLDLLNKHEQLDM